MKTGEPVESLSLSKFLVLYMRKYQNKINIYTNANLYTNEYYFSLHLGTTYNSINDHKLQ